MSKRIYTHLLQDMLDAIDKIDQYTADYDFAEFENNSLVIDGVVRNLEIIGEAANHIPEEIQLQYTTIPWAQIIGLRNIVIHEYFGIDTSIIWTIATSDLPQLRSAVEKIISEQK
ncbi:MAG TPA: DUF86 domain-containing protein [Patescibacteria group bacterium]|nr:DUF86 domain-containing protein [Patescibacteria group bacterium]